MHAVLPGPAVVGHRGMAGHPESSLAAFRAAIAVGVEAVECDVRTTADGVRAVWHDERLPDGRPVGAVSFAAARSLVPHLARVGEVAALCAAEGVALQVDLKEIGGELAAIGEVEALVGAERLFVTTLEDVSVRALKRARPDLRVGLSLGADRGEDAWLRRRLEGVPWARVRRCGADFLSVQHRLAGRGLFLQARALGFPVLAWTVDEPRRIEEVLRWRGLAGLITNRPDLALPIRRRLRGEDGG